MLFFTADQHFGHGNIIHYQERPFSSANEMDAVMIGRWNEVVGPHDSVIHLGDLSLNAKANDYISQLNGRISIVANKWHHDRGWLRHAINTVYRSRNGHRLEILEPMVVMVASTDIGPKSIVLSHYPLAEWDKKHYGAWHLHGHSHCRHVPKDPSDFIMDVGVDCNNFFPVSLEEVVRRMEA